MGVWLSFVIRVPLDQETKPLFPRLLLSHLFDKHIA